MAVTSGDPQIVWAAAEAHRQDLSPAVRSALGIFYTPPAIAERLLDDLAAAGARFDGSQTFCDPACGGGAFLLPVARRIGKYLAERGGDVSDLARCLIGIDLDPGGVALTRAALDCVAIELFGSAPTWDLRIGNSLWLAVEGRLPNADVVVGNPPFGRVRLSSHERAFFRRSVRGHANLYSLFVDVAFRSSRGLVGYVMPTSWLAGDYFASLRFLVSGERPLHRLRFVPSRSEVFPGVLQEMCLAVFGTESIWAGARIFSGLDDEIGWQASVNGQAPWVIARKDGDAELVQAATRAGVLLKGYGYTVHTGPLVWNRAKQRLKSVSTSRTVPIVWADAVRSGDRVNYRASRRPRLHFDVNGYAHLVLRRPAVLVKRTTAKEQSRRLVAAAFDDPPAIVENHLNVLIPNAHARVSTDTLTVLLNSGPVDRLFRALSGTVAVSATELMALPLPQPAALAHLTEAQDPDAVVLDAYLAPR